MYTPEMRFFQQGHARSERHAYSESPRAHYSDYPRDALRTPVQQSKKREAVLYQYLCVLRY